MDFGSDSASGPGSTACRPRRRSEFTAADRGSGATARSGCPRRSAATRSSLIALPRRADRRSSSSATGIANIYARDPMTMRAIRETLGELAPGRFVLGLGVSHGHLVAGLRGHEYGKPVATMRAYLEAMEKATLHGAEAGAAGADRDRRAAPEDARARARAKTRGAHPYFVPPEHTARAREILGKGALAAARADGAARDRRREGARDRARGDDRSTSGCPNYQNNLKWLGFDDADFDERRQRPARRRDRRVGRREGDRASASRRTTTRAPTTSASSRSGPTARRGADMRVLELLAPAKAVAARGSAASSGAGATRARARRAEQARGDRARRSRSASASAARRSRPRRASRTIALPRAARRAAAPRSPRSARDDPHDARRPHLRQVASATSCARFARDFANPPDLVAFPRDEADVAALLDWCGERRHRRDPVRRRLERRRRRRGRASATATRGAVSHRPRPPRPRARDRPHVARGAHPGRRARPRARGPAPPARAHAAPLPAVVRVLDARRLDRDALGRPLRDALHAHRRLRRVAARRDARRRRRDAAPARLGRRAEPRPAVHRLGGHARRHHRGVDAAPGPAALPRAGASVRFAGADGFARGAAAVRALAQSGLYPTNCRLLDAARGADTRAPATATPRVLVLGFESADHALDAWIARALELLPRRTAATCPTARGAHAHATTAARARGRGRRLAQRVPRARRTCATRSSRSA